MNMLNNINLLDCTLRDGGYINEWNFGKRTVRSIISSLVRSNVDFVELGFLRDCKYDANKTLYNNIAEAKSIIPGEAGNTKFILMALHDQYGLDKLEDSDGSIYAVRVTFHDYDVDEGLDYVRRVMEKGYRVFCNPINIMGYSDYQILNILEKANKINPFGFSIVDTFGSMKKKDLIRLYYLCENNLAKGAVLGFHLHENMSISFMLAQTFLEMLLPSRKCVIDASLLGMGRVPGNLHIELMMDYLNEEYNAKYITEYALDAIDNHILNLKQKYGWGYSTEYYLSAKYNLHRNYAEYLSDKGKLTTKGIDIILSQIEDNKRTAFDSKYAEKLYVDFQSCFIDDTQALSGLKEEIGQKSILVLAPGKSLISQSDRILDFIDGSTPYVISANFISEIYPINKAFFSNAKRFESQEISYIDEKIILTSNIKCEYNKKVNYMDLYGGEICSDNCVIMLIKLIVRMGFSNVYLAGFDGYSKEHSEDNYFDSYFESNYSINSNPSVNMEITELINKLRRLIHVEFVTHSLYDAQPGH